MLASGAHGVPVVPDVAARLPSGIRTLTANEYRNPAQLDWGRVLVVGASATGLQLADEIRRSGRPVTIAVGEHIRMPRLYRGRDIQWWLEAVGILDERYDEVDDIVRARRVPSPQLVGSPERRTLDLNALIEQGVDVVGRLVGVNDGRLQFSGSLANHCAMADLKLNRLLDRIDAWCAERRIGDVVAEPERFAATRVEAAPRLALDLKKEPVATIVWATGLRPDYSWLQAPVLDHKGRLRHDGGVAADRALRARAELHAAAQIELHPRRRGRRARPVRASPAAPAQPLASTRRAGRRERQSVGEARRSAQWTRRAEMPQP